MRAVDAAWAAGLIDGEGCITISRHKPSATQHAKSIRYVLILKVTMCDERTVRLIAALFGVGSVSSTHFNPHRTSRAYSWIASGKSAVAVINRILPYMVTKRDEARIGLRFEKLPRAQGGGRLVPPELLAKREALFREMRAAKPRLRVAKCIV